MAPLAQVPLVVVADDDPLDIVLFEQALASTGHRHKLIALPSAQSAMNYLQRWLAVTPGEPWVALGLLLLDWRVPAGGGLAVLNWIRGEPRLRNLRVIVISHTDRPDDVSAARAAGAQAWISKQMPIEELVSTMGTALLACHAGLQRSA